MVQVMYRASEEPFHWHSRWARLVGRLPSTPPPPPNGMRSNGWRNPSPPLLHGRACNPAAPCPQLLTPTAPVTDRFCQPSPTAFRTAPDTPAPGLSPSNARPSPPHPPPFFLFCRAKVAAVRPSRLAPRCCPCGPAWGRSGRCCGKWGASSMSSAAMWPRLTAPPRRTDVPLFSAGVPGPPSDTVAVRRIVGHPHRHTSQPTFGELLRLVSWQRVAGSRRGQEWHRLTTPPSQWPPTLAVGM